MDMQVVQTAENFPNGCTICHTHKGPFVYIPGITHFDVPTAEGLATIESPILVCIGVDDPGNPAVRPLGCARLLGRAADCLPPAEADGLKAHAKAALERAEKLHHELVKANADLAEARKMAPQVVSVDDLMERLKSDAPAAAAG